MAVKVNWRDVTPNIAHNTAIVWPVLGPVGTASGSYRATPIRGYTGITRHMIQPRMSGDYHVHYDREQVYYFTDGCGKLNIDEVIYECRKGDAVCIPPTSYHQMINDTDDWLVHLIINGRQVSEEEQEANKKINAASNAHGSKQPIAHRRWLDSMPGVSHGAALLWSIFAARGTPDRSYTEAPLEGVQKITIHRLQPRLETGPHSHSDIEQVYVFTEGRGKMIVGDETIDVEEGDYVYCPLDVQHGLINDSDDWVEHLIISAAVD